MQCKSLNRSRSAFSLIEVVAALVLVGSLLVAVLLAHKKNTIQMKRAQNRIAAIAALDNLLTQTDKIVTEFAKPDGKVPGSNPYYWRRFEMLDSETDRLGAVVMRVELYDPAFDNAATLASVEMIAARAKQGMQK